MRGKSVMIKRTAFAISVSVGRSWGDSCRKWDRRFKFRNGFDRPRDFYQGYITHFFSSQGINYMHMRHENLYRKSLLNFDSKFPLTATLMSQSSFPKRNPNAAKIMIHLRHCANHSWSMLKACWSSKDERYCWP